MAKITGNDLRGGAGLDSVKERLNTIPKQEIKLNLTLSPRHGDNGVFLNRVGAIAGEPTARLYEGYMKTAQLCLRAGQGIDIKNEKNGHLTGLQKNHIRAKTALSLYVMNQYQMPLDTMTENLIKVGSKVKGLMGIKDPEHGHEIVFALTRLNNNLFTSKEKDALIDKLLSLSTEPDQQWRIATILRETPSLSEKHQRKLFEGLDNKTKQPSEGSHYVFILQGAKSLPEDIVVRAVNRVIELTEPDEIWRLETLLEESPIRPPEREKVFDAFVEKATAFNAPLFLTAALERVPNLRPEQIEKLVVSLEQTANDNFYLKEIQSVVDNASRLSEEQRMRIVEITKRVKEINPIFPESNPA